QAVLEKVGQVRERAEQEQQAPYQDVNLDRMLLPVRVGGLRLVCSGGRRFMYLFYGRHHGAPSPWIEKREDEYPDEVDEVPVEARDFDDLIIAAGALVVAAQHPQRDDDEI